MPTTTRSTRSTGAAPATTTLASSSGTARAQRSLLPGDPITAWFGDDEDVEAEAGPARGTVLRPTRDGYDVLWRAPGPDGKCECIEVVTDEDDWLPGWYAEEDFAAARAAKPLTRSIEQMLQQAWTIDVPQSLTAMFCTMSYPRGVGTRAAFKLASNVPCPVGCYVPVTVRLYEIPGERPTSLLAVYLPEPLYVHIECRLDVVDCPHKRKVALGLGETVGVLFVSFGSTELKSVFMRRVRGEPHVESAELKAVPQASRQTKRKQPAVRDEDADMYDSEGEEGDRGGSDDE